MNQETKPRKHRIETAAPLLQGHTADLVAEYRPTGSKVPTARLWRTRMSKEDGQEQRFTVEAQQGPKWVWDDVCSFGEMDTPTTSATFANAAHQILTHGLPRAHPERVQAYRDAAALLDEVA